MKRENKFSWQPKNLLVIIGWCLMSQEVVPANWKWSSTIRKIDDDSNSSNFYLNIDLRT